MSSLARILELKIIFHSTLFEFILCIKVAPLFLVKHLYHIIITSLIKKKEKKNTVHIASLEYLFTGKNHQIFKGVQSLYVPSIQKGTRKKQQKIGNKSATINSSSRTKVT